MSELKGIMIYFDKVEPYLTGEYTTEEVGELFISMIDYAMNGTEPKYTDRAMRSAWINLKSMLNYGIERFESTCKSNTYSVYCREAKRHGETPLTRSEWELSLSNDIERYQTISSDIVSIKTEKETKTEKEKEKETETEKESVCERKNNSESVRFVALEDCSVHDVQEAERNRQKQIEMLRQRMLEQGKTLD